MALAMDGETTATTAVSLLDLPDHVIVENILPELFPSSLLGDFPLRKFLRDILSFASTCTRIHALASHPSLWRNVNARVFLRPSSVGSSRPPPLPLGAVHCGVFCSEGIPFTLVDIGLITKLHELTAICGCADQLAEGSRDRLVGAISSLRQLTRLEIEGGLTARMLRGVELPRSLASLMVGGVADELIEFFEEHSPLSSLVCLDCHINYGDVTAVVGVITRVCPVLEEATITGYVSGRDVASLAAIPTVRKVTLNTSTGVSGDGVAQSVSVSHLREFTANVRGHVSASFLSLFPDLVKLELDGHLSMMEDDLAAIGGMASLQSLSLNGRSFEDECRQLLPLSRHPSASSRLPLKFLDLLWFNDVDLSEFLSSRWCSHLEELVFRGGKSLSGGELERLSAANGVTLSGTLRSFTADCAASDVDGPALGRFVSGLHSLDKLRIKSMRKDLDVNGLLCEMGGRCVARPTLFVLEISRFCARCDLAAVLPVLSGATEIALRGNFCQDDADAVASACKHLRRFEVMTRSSVTRPEALDPSCELVYH